MYYSWSAYQQTLSALWHELGSAPLQSIQRSQGFIHDGAGILHILGVNVVLAAALNAEDGGKAGVHAIDDGRCLGGFLGPFAQKPDFFLHSRFSARGAHGDCAAVDAGLGIMRYICFKPDGTVSPGSMLALILVADDICRDALPARV